MRWWLGVKGSGSGLSRRWLDGSRWEARPANVSGVDKPRVVLGRERAREDLGIPVTCNLPGSPLSSLTALTPPLTLNRPTLQPQPHLAGPASSVLTVWSLTDATITIQHEITVPVGPPLALRQPITAEKGRRRANGSFPWPCRSLWRYLDAKLPIQVGGQKGNRCEVIAH